MCASAQTTRVITIVEFEISNFQKIYFWSKNSISHHFFIMSMLFLFSHTNMQLFIENIRHLENRQVSNMIIDIIQNFKYHPQSPHFMFEHFGIILDILCSDKIVKFDRAKKTQIVNETVHRLPQKMYMETQSVDLSTLLSRIVRDVLFGDVMNKNEDMREIMQIDTPLVTFSRYIDVAELHRQMIIMSRIFRKKDIANSNMITQVVEKLSTKFFLNINCIR